ncbi:MAG: hypothetical protein WDN04_15020 [Rhodospirillales bacterium]
MAAGRGPAGRLPGMGLHTDWAARLADFRRPAGMLAEWASGHRAR